MAEERNLATARATDVTDDEGATKEELQRRMEEARESITQTVTEIKETVSSQYQSVKDALDWREQFRRRPVAFSVGALSVGFIIGYSLAGALKGDSYGQDYYREYEEGYEPSEAGGVLASAPRSYAAQAITGGAYGASAHTAGAQRDLAESAGEYDSTYSGSTDEYAEEESDKPGLIERFKETRAYDRLEQEVAALGNRFLDELSRTAQAVVLPALFAKVKDYFGVDLSGKNQGAAGSQRTTGTTATRGGQSNEPAGARGAQYDPLREDRPAPSGRASAGSP